MNRYIRSIFVDENNKISSKRCVGIISALALIAYMFIHPSDSANNSVLILAMACFGFNSAEKVGLFNKAKEEIKDESNQDK